MNYKFRKKTTVFISAFTLMGLIVLFFGGCGSKKAEPLLCYVGGTMRPAMEEIAGIYEKKTGQKVNLDFADSGQLLIRIETMRRGDIYVCHDPFLGSLKKKGLCRDAWTIAAIKPMIAVPKGNPKNIRGIMDLARPGLRLGLTDEFYSTCGHINKIMFEKSGAQELIERNIITRTRTGSEVANAVYIGNIDAAIVWNAVIYLRRDKLDAVKIEPEFYPDPEVDVVTSATFGVIDLSNISVTLATLECSKQPEKARAFAEFVANSTGRNIFRKHGFSPASPDEKNEELYLYSGAGLRPVVSEIVENFSKETGKNVICDYSGSGVLTSRIKLAMRGDLFLPGDVFYIEQLEKEGLIVSKKMVCYFIPVILVKKGNPKGIHTIHDLVRPGIRLGLGNPDACAIGRRSMKIFEKNGIDKKFIDRNLAFSSMTVNELGIQIRMVKIDAAIVWDPIAAYYGESADTVVIPGERNIISNVVIGLLTFSKSQKSAQQFMEYIAGERGKAILRNHNYTTVLQD